LSEPIRVEHEGQLAPTEERAVESEKHVSPLALGEVRCHGRLFRLNQPLLIEVSSFAGGWCYESKPLTILAFGRTKQGALASFTEDFSVLWDAMVQASDQSLTLDALAVKRAFQGLVRAVIQE
jgi:hypothetical protein